MPTTVARAAPAVAKAVRSVRPSLMAIPATRPASRPTTPIRVASTRMATSVARAAHDRAAPVPAAIAQPPTGHAAPSQAATAARVVVASNKPIQSICVRKKGGGQAAFGESLARY